MSKFTQGRMNRGPANFDDFETYLFNDSYFILVQLRIPLISEVCVTCVSFIVKTLKLDKIMFKKYSN